MIKITFRKKIQKKLLKRDGTGPNRCIDKAAKEPGVGDTVEAAAGGECGPGMHRHPDVYHDKCHPIEYKHRRKQVGPNKKKDGDATRKIKKPKKLQLKKLQLGRGKLK